MGGERGFIDALRALAASPAARGLRDDAAVLEVGGARLVLTHDVNAQGVHFLPDDPAEDVAWKLVAVNLSDLAAKGARPLGVLLGFTLGDEDWDRAFVRGLGAALSAFDVPLLGGDTVTAPRVLGLTALGEASGPVPSRAGARPGDDVWVSGTIGDAGAGLRCLRGELPPEPSLIERYRRPTPRLEAGQALAALVSAMMDVSDGLLIDASRLAEASGIAVEVEMEAMPISPQYRASVGEDLHALELAATAGDDYELLFTAAPERRHAVTAVSEKLALPLTRIGRAGAGSGLRATYRGAPVPLPRRLGWEHG